MQHSSLWKLPFWMSINARLRIDGYFNSGSDSRLSLWKFSLILKSEWSSYFKMYFFGGKCIKLKRKNCNLEKIIFCFYFLPWLSFVKSSDHHFLDGEIYIKHLLNYFYFIKRDIFWTAMSFTNTWILSTMHEQCQRIIYFNNK